MASVLRPPFVVPRPADHSHWQGQPDNSAVLQLLTAARFFGAPGQAPTRLWRFDNDSGEAFWVGRPGGNAELLAALPAVATLIQAPFIVPRPGDESFWQAVLGRNFRLLNLVAAATPLVNPPWRFGCVDDAHWQGQPDNSGVLQLLTAPKFFGAPGQAPTRLWRWDHDSGETCWVRFVPPLNLSLATALVFPVARGGAYNTTDEAAAWQPTLARNLTLLIGAPAATPLINPPWRFGYSDDASWQGEPGASALLAPLLTAGGQVISRRWGFGLDDAPTWQPQPRRNFDISFTPPATPFVNPPWEFGYSDDASWQGRPRQAAPISLLTAVKFYGAGGETQSRRWGFGYEDASVLPPPAVRNQMLLATAITTVLTANPEYVVGYASAPRRAAGYPAVPTRKLPKIVS